MMECSGLSWIVLIVGLACTKNLMLFKIICIEKHERLQQNLFQSADDWRAGHLIKDKCPQVDASRDCTSFLLNRFLTGSDAIRPAKL